MAQNIFQHGSSSVSDFYGWVNERHAIYIRRFVEEKPKPWTKDPIMREYKFTNVFRELDRGTLALRKMERPYVDALAGEIDPDNAYDLSQKIVFNTFWYRTFNWVDHAENLGFVTSYQQVYDYFINLHHKGGRIFTGAHMVRGDNGEVKVFPYLRLLETVWKDIEGLTATIVTHGTMKHAFDQVIKYRLVGAFNAYELCCDWRWSLGLNVDALTWGSIGPGAARGLQRLGYDGKSVLEMIELWKLAPKYLEPHVQCHFPLKTFVSREIGGGGRIISHGPKEIVEWPPFEIREVEHSLCEFDKHARCKAGEGRPRQKFAGE